MVEVGCQLPEGEDRLSCLLYLQLGCAQNRCSISMNGLNQIHEISNMKQAFFFFGNGNLRAYHLYIVQLDLHEIQQHIWWMLSLKSTLLLQVFRKKLLLHLMHKNLTCTFFFFLYYKIQQVGSVGCLQHLFMFYFALKCLKWIVVEYKSILSYMHSLIVFSCRKLGL